MGGMDGHGVPGDGRLRRARRRARAQRDRPRDGTRALRGAKRLDGSLPTQLARILKMPSVSGVEQRERSPDELRTSGRIVSGSTATKHMQAGSVASGADQTTALG